MNKGLVTGGTGFIGSYIAARLLEMGYFIYFLARPNTKFSAEERILRSLAPLTNMRRDRFKVIDCDLVNLLHHLKLERINHVWHCAASLSFKDEDEIETMATNVGGTKNLLALLSRIGAEKIHFISTAYVSDNDLANPYERSKAEAEFLIERWARDKGCSYAIYRPTIMVGDSKTGFASKFDGYYACCRAVYMLKQSLQTAHRRNKTFYLPLAFPGVPEMRINIVPIDLAVSAILDCASETGVFHITNSCSPRLDELVEMSAEILGVRGMYVGDQKNSHRALMQLSERLAHATKHYRPYLYESRIETTPGKSIDFPITETFVSRILKYAMSVNFKSG